jgi:diguanylate cyclase (GGDEF)-like protein
MTKGTLVYSDINVKMIILLFFLSIGAFVAHRVGLMDTNYPVLIKTSSLSKSLIYSPSVNTHFEKSAGIALNCQLRKLEVNDYCGVAIALSTKSTRYGLDLRDYNRFSATINYTAPLKNADIKIAFRNYNDNYATVDDPTSLKFNSISYNPNLYDSAVVIPFDSLKVEDWWTEQYQVEFNNSQVDLSNIVFIEILSDGMNSVGDYRIDIQNLVLYGQLISESNLLKLMLIIWLIIIICLITIQRNKLKHISMTDTLTGIYNRQGIRNWTNKKILSMENANDFYMFYLDLDDFKKVNDTYGHQVGDQLLIGFSNHIQNFLDSTPNITYAFARLSGDEFTLVIIGIKESELISFAEDFLSVLDLPILLEDHETHVRASLGIAELKQDVKTFEELLARADSAMYYAKKDGKNHYKIFNESVYQDLFFRKQTAEKIKNAIIQDDFHLNFMPIFDAKTLDMVSVEVLLRTNAESLKGIGPDVFIPIAEEYNLIKNIDLWVIEATFKQILKEQVFLSAIPSLVFCINISAVELHNPFFVPQLKELLALYHIKPEQIELELTETSLVDTDLMSIDMLKEVRDLGIKLTLDDFGTGYTAFSQLINYPVDNLKIDKSFIDDLDSTDNTQSTMIKAIISIAQSYQLKTIGEGVEQREQYEFLLEHGCDMIQGYFFAKPMPWEYLKKAIESKDSTKRNRKLAIEHNDEN